MGRQWNQIIESLGPLTGGTMSINANLTDIEALLTTLQADVADGIKLDPSAALTGQLDIATDDGGGQPLYGVQIGWQTPANDFRLISQTYPLPVSSIITNGTLTSGTLTANIVPVRGTTTIGTLTASTSNGTLFASNSTRNYLLVQCTSGTAYIDTNGTATTGNGILLTGGQAITFEGSFIPTGAISAITSTGTAQLIGRQG